MIPRLPLFLICVSAEPNHNTLVWESRRQTKYGKSIRSCPFNLLFFIPIRRQAFWQTARSEFWNKKKSTWWQEWKSEHSGNIRPSLNCPRPLSSSLWGVSAICALIPQWGPFSWQVLWQAGGGSRKVDMNGRQPSPLPLDWLGPAPCVWQALASNCRRWLRCHLAGRCRMPLVSLNLSASLPAPHQHH